MSDKRSGRGDDTSVQRAPLGPALRRAWIGYQRRLDEAMAGAGFDDRRFPDARVLRLCRRSGGMTIAQIGRELGISRQGAAKIVTSLDERGYVSVDPSRTNGREKVVRITPKATRYLAAQRRAVRAIENDLRRRLGAESLASLDRLLDVLGAPDDPRLRDYLRTRGVREL